LKSNGKKLNQKPVWIISGIGSIAIVLIIIAILMKQLPIFTPNPINSNLDSTTLNSPSIQSTDSELTFSSTSVTPNMENNPGIISAIDEMEQLFVPEGIFLMGDESSSAYTNEKPVHEVYLDAFWIDKYEISNHQYKKCVESGNCSKPNDEALFNNSRFENFPVVNITWNQAKEYCIWAKRDLPTEAQWEKAARGTKGQIYPWGNFPPNNKTANFNNIIGKSTMSGNYPDGTSYFGSHDMAGNVWEWVNDWYSKDYYFSQSVWNNPEGADSIQLKVIRGGSWSSPAGQLRSSYRSWYIFDSSNLDIGFRCAMDADE
jgi:formylglycine-generating enzyme required for sulfatase activity